MPKKKLIYLHIEKSAGTSQRNLFKELIGQENIFWHSKDNTMSKYLGKRNVNQFLVGGHKYFDFYQRYKKELVFTAVVRDPIDRVISLFNYDKLHNIKALSKHGFDPDSLKNTLKNSKVYREKINNTQCKYLSGSKKFLDVLQALDSSSFLVSDYNKLEVFNNFLSSKLNLNFKKTPHINKGQDNYSMSLGIDQETIELIELLTEEDRKLYEHVVKHTIINTVKANDWVDLKDEIARLSKDLADLDILNLTKKNNKSIVATILLRNTSSREISISEKGLKIFCLQYFLNNKRSGQPIFIDNVNLELSPYEEKIIETDITTQKPVRKSMRFLFSTTYESENLSGRLNTKCGERYLYSWDK